MFVYSNTYVEFICEFSKLNGRVPCDVVVNELDSSTVGSKFELQSPYYIHF